MVIKKDKYWQVWLVIILLVSTDLYFSTIIHRKDHSKDLFKKELWAHKLKNPVWNLVETAPEPNKRFWYNLDLEFMLLDYHFKPQLENWNWGKG